jgi:hypothetical protein
MWKINDLTLINFSYIIIYQFKNWADNVAQLNTIRIDLVTSDHGELRKKLVHSPLNSFYLRILLSPNQHYQFYSWADNFAQINTTSGINRQWCLISLLVLLPTVIEKQYYYYFLSVKNGWLSIDNNINVLDNFLVRAAQTDCLSWNKARQGAGTWKDSKLACHHC